MALEDADRSGNRFEILVRKLKPKLKHIDFVFKIFLIVIFLLLALEFFSFIVVSVNKIIRDEKAYGAAGGYTGKDWVQDFYEESSKREMEYYPYVGFRFKPLEGNYVNINSNSIRKTDNPCKKSNSIRIFMFGGSTMFSPGTIDRDTIPSIISRKLCDKNISAEVTNFGQSGYVNSQELIKLLLELRSGNIPDYVIFYDGAGEILSSYQNRIAGFPQNQENHQIEFNSRYKFNIISPLMQTNLMKLATTPKLTEKLQKKEQEIPNNLAKDTVEVYFQNKKIIDVLGKEYGFTAFYFWEPVLFTKKTLSEGEKKILQNKDMDTSFGKKTYKIIGPIKEDRFYDISNVFDNVNESIYGDWAHISDKGNEIVAERMVDLIKQFI